MKSAAPATWGSHLNLPLWWAGPVCPTLLFSRKISHGCGNRVPLLPAATYCQPPGLILQYALGMTLQCDTALLKDIQEEEMTVFTSSPQSLSPNRMPFGTMLSCKIALFHGHNQCQLQELESLWAKPSPWGPFFTVAEVLVTGPIFGVWALDRRSIMPTLYTSPRHYV